MKFVVTIIALISLSFVANAQEERDLLDPKTRDILLEALDGEIAKEHVTQIAQFHRVQASPGYRSAANYVLEQLRKYGYSEKDAYIESFESDGKKTYQTWQSPSGWDATEAELHIVEPVKEKLVSFAEITMSLMTYSNPGDEEAELVWVGQGTKDEDYKDKDVDGRFVLATGYGGDVHRLAVLKYEAKAVVCYLDDERSKEHPDMVQYTGIWPRTEELENVTFGFNISRKQGEQLKEMLLAGQKVVLHGWVKGKGLHPFFMDVVVAHIRGAAKPNEELIFCSHLDHPKHSANDNASGSGAILDIARALKTAIDGGKLPKPSRSLRFLWVPEWNGTMAYIDAHPEMKGPDLGGKFLAAMNLDMVGENLELLHSRLYITRTPRSISSCVNDVVSNMAKMTDKLDIRTPTGSHSQMNYRVVPYMGGSDHMMFIDRKIPAVMFSHSDWTHHTSEDLPDKVDPVELERCEMIATNSLWYLANLNEAQAFDLIELIRTNAARAVSELGRYIRPRLDTTNIRQLPMAWAEIDNVLDFALWEALDATNSVLHFYADDLIRERVIGMRPHLSRRADYLYGLSRTITQRNGYASDLPPPLDEKPDTSVPVRLTRGPLDFRLPESKLPEKDAAWYRSPEFTLTDRERFEIVNYIDGKRTISDIRKAVIAQFRSIPLSIISRYIRDLVRVGVLKWR